MENKRVIPFWINIVLTVLCLGSIGVYLYQLPIVLELGFALSFITISNIIPNILALIYCVSGYKKDSATFFKAFCYLQIICFGFYIISRASFGVSGFGPILGYASSLVSFGIFCIFSVAKDLKQVKSLVLAGCLVLCSIVNIITMVGLEWIYLFGTIAREAGLLVFFLMVFAKYKDKTSRGTT